MYKLVCIFVYLLILNQTLLRLKTCLALRYLDLRSGVPDGWRVESLNWRPKISCQDFCLHLVERRAVPALQISPVAAPLAFQPK